MSETFKRTKEDFICEQCGTEVVGDGYTNHCPKCLWSKHVDDNPGDRQAECGGMMKPISVSQKSGEFRVLQRCVACGHERANKLQKGDSFDVAVSLHTLRDER
jgi:hypothetical protein